MVPGVQVATHTIGPGHTGIRDTLHLMRGLVRGSVAHPLVRLTAAGCCRGTGTDALGQIRLLRLYLDQHTEFLRDPRGVELLQSPVYLLTHIQTRGTVPGDCDDLAMLAAALGMAIGLRARFIVIGQHQLSHVFTALSDPRGSMWVPLDLTRPGATIPAAMLAHLLVVEV